MYRTFSEAQTALLKGETSSQALVLSFLAAIEERNPSLNAFLTVDREGALRQAEALDVLVATGNPPPLAGLVLGVKDVICIRDQKVTCASRMLADFTSLYDATAIERLRQAGAIFIGKLNCDEFAMGSSNENSYFGPVRNPINPAYVPGGSSGGSAAAVAAGLCHAALGTDTGGSIRQPAAYCGVLGIKPTYGRVSRRGLVAYASSFDSMGVFAHTAEDAARILTVMAGHDEWDATSAPIEVPAYPNLLKGSVKGLKIGLPKEFFGEGLDPEINTVIQKEVARLASNGASVHSVSLPNSKYGIATYYILTTAEASSNLARYDGVRYGYRADVRALRAEMKENGDEEPLLNRLYAQTRTEGFGDEVKRRIMLGTYVLSAGYYDAYYGKAQQVRRLIRSDFERAFDEVDVLVTPTAPTTAFPLGSQTEDPLTMYLNDIYTVTANLAGIPGISVPVGLHSNGLPIGLQVLGRPFDEALLLNMAHHILMD
ncbi:MAG TPA: Asp-tRNA(Asn)/Glu-tRNA(Gln) amidotransferase GatCAB subunit A [Bacteroidetes bacterium]|nr:Asp-tRNA(Asn)/Glu-tRNA(Gln) amidotransferase GatCAB subunit A [Bacteroidota bacterium]HRR08329.1 Asp-tRNA(Asn)/Glu-tRNA(Gln) amidotransferase subunit GatA [Rhodothermales bacterium]